jgi:hypothetical protein
VNSKRPRYYAVKLRVGGKYRNVYVHRLIWEAFNGLIPDGMEVRHLNHQPRDNRLDNLAAGTHAENMRDSVVAGRMSKKLSAESVRALRRFAELGWPRKELARIFGVAPGTVSQIVRREIWKHVA